MKKLLILLAILLPTLALFYFGLSRDPNVLPSALLEKEAPDFQLKTIDGAEVHLKDSRGKPVLINFCFTLCSSCAMEHQLIREAYKIYSAQGIQFYSVLYEDTPENAQQFMKTYGAAAPILLDKDLRTAIDYGVAGVPESFFINREGKVVFKQAGVLTEGLLAEQFDRLLKEGQKP